MIETAAATIGTRQLIVADWVLPIDAAPIKGGAVRIDGATITAVGPAERLARTPRARRIELPGCLLMPGLIDAHTHLTFAGQAPCHRPFGEWIDRMAETVMGADPDALAEDAGRGAGRLIRAGVTAVGDSGPFEAVARAIAGRGLGGRFYLELFGPDPVDAVARAADAGRRLAALASHPPGRLALGLAPHAPYTVSPALYREAAALAARRKLPLTTHLAESPEETDYCRAGRGPLAERLSARGLPLPVGGRSPVEWLLDVLPDGPDAPPLLAAHLTQARPHELSWLAGRRGTAAALCPVSNAFCGHGRPPLAALQASGITLALGTDSAVTAPRQDLFDDLRMLLWQARIEGLRLAPRALLAAATLGGARALGLAARLGSLTPGKQADLIAVQPGPGDTAWTEDPHETALLQGAADRVRLTLIAGRVMHSTPLEEPTP